MNYNITSTIDKYKLHVVYFAYFIYLLSISLNNESTYCFSSLYYKLKNVKEICIGSVKYLPHGKRIWSSSSKSFVCINDIHVYMQFLEQFCSDKLDQTSAM
jgi:hypothetical protein